jgi:hypothetical protein
MKKTPIAVNTKKPAAAEPKTAVERPHKDLTEVQEQVADLASDILLNGGAREDVDLLLKALLRHRIRRMSFNRGPWAIDAAESDRSANGSAILLADKVYQHLAKYWPEKKDGSEHRPTKPVPNTVAEMMRANVRQSLREEFDEFLTDEAGIEPVWLFNQVLHLTNCGNDLVEHFCRIMDTAGIYVRVPWEHKERVKEFVAFLEKAVAA